MIQKIDKFLWCTLGAILLSMTFSACTSRKSIIVTPQEKTGKLYKKSELPETIVPEISAKPDLEKLKKIAEEFVAEEKYKQAIYAYNKVLAASDEKTKSGVLKAIDPLLARVDPETIKEIAGFKENLIPLPMLMYRLGLNLISHGDYPLARETLKSFMEKYPDDPRVPDAADLLKILKDHEFKKNIMGCMLPLSGRFSAFGQRALKGIEMAVHDLSKDYGQKIMIIVKDTRSDSHSAVQCVKELAEKNVAAIAGPMITAGDAGEKAEQLGIPMIAMTQKQQVATEGGYIFSNFLTPEMQTKALVSFAVRFLGIKKFAILYPDDRYGKTYMRLFWDRVDEEQGYIAASESYSDDQTDFSKVIKKLIGFSYPLPGFFKPDETPVPQVLPDNNGRDTTNTQEQSKIEKDQPVINFKAIFIPDKSFNVSLILPQLAYNDITGVYLLGTNIWHDNTLLKNAAKYAKNSVITEGYFAESSHVKSREFAKNFQAIYNEEPRFIEAVSYDTISMLVKTAMEPEINSRKALRDALSGKRMFDGVAGKTIFDENGNARRELFFLTVKNGKFVEITH